MGMAKPLYKNYVISFCGYMGAVTLHEKLSSSDMTLRVLSTALLFVAIANFGYQLFKYYDQHDELQQRNLMKGTCFGAILTGVLCLFYSFLGNSAPVFAPEWAFYMLVIFSTLGQQFYIYRTR